MKLFKKILPLFLILTFVCLCSTWLTAGNRDEDKDTGNKAFANQELLNTFFQKLYNLEQTKQGKINIVHIGDSHIQADFFTNTIREALQDVFGNGGLGFTFPYSLLRTNGTRSVRYASNVSWESLLNVYPVADVGMGLSGIALYTYADNFILQLTAEERYEFNSIKIIYPTIEPHFRMSISEEPLDRENIAPAKSKSRNKYHKVRKGETLSSIGRKYGVTVTQIKKANGLKSNKVKTGRSLSIPVKTKSIATPVVAKTTINKDNIDYVGLVSKPYHSIYKSDELLNRITILPDGKSAMYNLNGFVIENDKPGVIYHTIGVNGAKLSDYNKYPLFFKQLPILEPDLIILSFGTNESFGKLSASEYTYQLREFIANIKKLNKTATILVMTPPPSMFRKGRPNPFVTDYSAALMELNSTPVWDLYTRMGGASGIKANGDFSEQIGRDKVHYTQRGYQMQGMLFATDFIDAYTNFKKQRRQ